MDEPLSNLDAKLRHEMRVEICGLQQRLGMTVVYVTLDRTEATGMAEKVILMRAGEIEQVGTPPMNLMQLANAWRVDRDSEPHPPCGIFDHQQWPQAPRCRDFFCVTPDLTDGIAALDGNTETKASDHQPLYIELRDR